MNANNASTIKVIPEKEPLRFQLSILEMDLVVVEDVPAGYHYNIVVADEGAVRDSELPSQDCLEGCDCRSGNEIVSQPLHGEVVGWQQDDDILHDWDVDVVASSDCATYQNTLRRWCKPCIWQWSYRYLCDCCC